MKVRQEKLNDLGVVRAGYTFRSLPIYKANGELGIVQSKDLTDFELNPENLQKIDFNPAIEQLLQKNDVLLSIRGQFKATITPELSKPIIASSSVLKITLKTNEITPEFLVVFLNSTKARKYLHSKSTGAVVNSISISELRELPIPIISLEDQQKIVKIFNISTRVTALAKHKAELVKQLSNYTFNQSLKGATT